MAGSRAAIRAADYVETTLTLLKEKLQGHVRGDFNITGRDLTLLGAGYGAWSAGLCGAWEGGLKGDCEGSRLIFPPVDHGEVKLHCFAALSLRLKKASGGFPVREGAPCAALVLSAIQQLPYQQGKACGALPGEMFLPEQGMSKHSGLD